MAKVKFDVTGSDPERAVQGGGDPPKPGLYECKVTKCEPGFARSDDGKPDRKRPRIEVIYSVDEEGEYFGSPLYDYITFTDASVWKYDQFLQAFGVATSKKRKGEFDTDDILNRRCKVKVRGDSWEGNYRARVGAVLALEDEDEADLADELDEEEAEETEEEWTEEEIDALKANDLRKVIKEYSIDVPKGAKISEVREIVKQELLGDDEQADEEDDDDLPF